MLYPKATETRARHSLDGLWNFQTDPNEQGETEQWFNKGLDNPIKMPVPASYNDITTDEKLRDFVGTVWYERAFYFHPAATEERVYIRIGAAAHHAKVWINGVQVATNQGGYLPFEADITDVVADNNKIVLAVNNELSWDVLPPGKVEHQVTESGQTEKVNKQNYDFFHYAGIHRSVYVYTKPKHHVEDVHVETDYDGNTGVVKVTTKTNNPRTEHKIDVTIVNDQNEVEATMVGEEAVLSINDVRLWDTEDPYLYHLDVRIIDQDDTTIDHYYLHIGVRTIAIEHQQILLNGQPIYLTGYGKHEDSLTRGKGFDHVMNVRDFYLMQWTNANSFRTSHYPYAEEVLDLADEMGFLIINEAPAVGILSSPVPATGSLLPVFDDKEVVDPLLAHHLEVMRQLIHRDKNHPSVIMWSIANEASTMEPDAEAYFTPIVEEVRRLDKRPIMNVNLMLIEPEKCVVSKLVDVIGLNVYFGWYSTPGDLEQGKIALRDYLTRWNECFDKPLIVTEFGVDTIAGLHKLPPVMFSEEFQVEFLRTYQDVFDEFDFVVGEHVWNFADFMTMQDIVRIDGNKKGVFTRDRQPKMAAHQLKERWDDLATRRLHNDGRENKNSH